MIKPIVTYAIETFWEDLQGQHLDIIDSCKWLFFKKVLGLHRCTKNRLVALICNLPFLTEELAAKLGRTPAYSQYITSLEEKLADVDQDFFLSPAIAQTDWQGPQYKKRHLITRVSVHGFHFQLCTNSKSHDRTSACRCRYSVQREAGTYYMHLSVPC